MDYPIIERLQKFAIVLLVLTLAACAGLPAGSERPSVTIADWTLNSATLLEQQFNLKLRIQNPNPDEFTVDGIAFEIEINDEPFAKGVGNQGVTVPRYGTALMNVEAVSTLSTLFKQLAKFALDKPGLNYRLKGTLSIAGGYRIPFDKRGELNINPFAPRGVPRGV